VFLFKMFDEHFINSFGIQFWFVSMILQFYLVFPFLAKWMDSGKVGLHIITAVAISLGWATLVCLSGNSDKRIWNSFFLQYLWEFVIGMELGNYFYKNQDIKSPSKFYLLVIGMIGVALVGYTGFRGGCYKLYNDIPSLFGYIAPCLLLFSFGLKWINSFFIYTCKFAYEWYLIHILVFSGAFFYLIDYFKPALIGVFALVLSYVLAIGYHRIIKLFIR